MKRVIRILSLGLLLSISTVALAGKDHDRNGHDGYYDNSGRQHHGARHDSHYKPYRDHRNHRRHYAKHYQGNRQYMNIRRHARRHSHHGYYCYDRHPHGYVPPRMHYSYSGPELVIVYQPGSGLHIGGG